MERGYGGVIPQQDIPEFLSKLFHISAREGYSNSTFNTKVKEMRKYLARGTPNAMKYVYGKVVDAIEFRNSEMLDKAIYLATQERTRYFAERISRTELARAYHDGFMAKWANDPDVVAFKWKLSSRHPVYDICDVYAHADLYNLGVGVFPKDKVPMLPAHPHCMCRLQPVFKENVDISKEKNQVEKGGLAYIKSTSIRHQEKLLGVNGRSAVMMGVSWTQRARNYSGAKLIGRLAVKGYKAYNKVVEYGGRKAHVWVRADGRIVPTEVHDINASFSPTNKSKPNAVILHGSPAGGGKRQYGIRIYDLNGDSLVSFHYGHHGNPKRHPYGKCVNGVKTGYHKHYWTPKENGTYEPETGEELSDIEEVFLKGLI